MKERVEQTSYTKIISNTLARASESGAVIADLVVVLSRNVPHVLGINAPDLTIAAIRQTPVVFVQKPFGVEV